MNTAIWTSFIAVAGTLGSGALGYIASREKTKTELTGITVELRKLNQPAKEKQRQARRDLYQRYLGIVAKVEPLLRRYVSTALDIDDAERSKLGIEMNALGSELSDALGEVQVLASDDVAKSAEDVHIQVAKVLGKALAGLLKIKAEIDAGIAPSESPSAMLDRVLTEGSLKPNRATLIRTMKKEIEL